MSDYNEEQSKFKDAKRGVIEQRPMPNKNKRGRRIELEYRTNLRLFNPSWKTYPHRYRTVEEAEATVKNLNRKYIWTEYRIKQQEQK